MRSSRPDVDALGTRPHRGGQWPHDRKSDWIRGARRDRRGHGNCNCHIEIGLNHHENRSDSSQFLSWHGGYAWQLAEYLQDNHADGNGSYTLSKSIPPELQNPLATYPEFLDPDRSVTWSRSARITHNTLR